MSDLKLGDARFDAYLREEPILCSQGGIPYNKYHLDKNDAEIKKLNEKTNKLRATNALLVEALEKAMPFIGYQAYVPEIVEECEQALASAKSMGDV